MSGCHSQKLLQHPHRHGAFRHPPAPRWRATDLTAVCSRQSYYMAHSSCQCTASGAEPVGPQDQNIRVELPEELQGLSINDQGLLIDEKTGKVINQMGATRFDVAVSAMRGLLDPPAWVENTERTPGLILGSLVQFPTRYCFSVVGQNSPEFQQDVQDMIARVCQTTVDPSKDVRTTSRLGGKFISMQIDAEIRAPEIVAMVMEELGKDPRVKMRY